MEAQRSFPTLLLYVSLFHQCIAGPIVRYKDINAELLNRDGMTEEEFKDKMLGLNKEFQMLNKETIKQEQLIVKNLNDLLD